MNVTPTMARARDNRTLPGGIEGTIPCLALHGVKKNFGAVAALRDVDLEIRPGEVHAIVGENGAGKSTLIAIAAGVIKANEGHLIHDDVSIDEPTVGKMREIGVAVVYQQHSLVPDLTVLENLQLASPHLSNSAGIAAMEALVREVSGDTRKIPLSRRIAELTLAEVHVVEIARALAMNPRIIFFDEPTEPFQEADVERLFELIQRLRGRQVAVVYVSHRLHEVEAIADRISVMRDGKIIDSRPAGEIGRGEIVTLIAGRPIAEVFPAKAGKLGTTILEVKGLKGEGFESVDLTVRAGEILGLAGIEGEGQRAFLRCTAGIEKRQAGTVAVHGKGVPPGTAAARKAGIDFISDDRHAEGLLMPLTIRENLGIGASHRFAHFGIVQPTQEEKLSSSLAEDLRIKTPTIEAPVTSLSGGNQQKVVIGRTLAAAPRVILFDEPTKGVDIGSRSEIYHKLRALAEDGLAVVILSSDGVELEGLCDRVVVFARGRIVRELTGAGVNDASITEANLTATASRGDENSSDWRDSRSHRLLSSDRFPALVLTGAIAVVLGAMYAIQPLFLSEYNLGSVMTFIALLGLISVGQFMTVLVGGIDLSVGALAGLTVILASFLMPVEASAAQLAVGAIAIVFSGIAVGLLHGFLVTVFRLPAIIVTLASLIGLQGLSLILRPTPGGMITYAISDVTTYALAGIPVGLLAVCALVLLLEIVLLRTDLGRRLRAVGSQPEAARRIGTRIGYYKIGAFAASGAFAALGGLLLAGQIGIGSPGIGLDYTIMSITAVVLGGASMAGGRGSVVCTLLGAALVQTVSSSSSFLNADSSVHYALLGGVTLLAAVLFSVVRRDRVAH